MRKIIFIIIILALVSILLKSMGRGTDPNFKFLKQMEPESRRKFASFLDGIKQLGYTPVIRESGRSYQQQKIYYEQDHRNAKPGGSSHEVGKAVDMDIYKNGKVFSKKTPKASWLNTGVPQLAQDLGIRWGGNFKGYADNNHFDYLKV